MMFLNRMDSGLTSSLSLRMNLNSLALLTFFLDQQTDISSILGIVPSLSFQMKTTKNISINNQALANLMISSDVNGRLLDSPSCEEVRSSQLENIRAHCGISS